MMRTATEPLMSRTIDSNHINVNVEYNTAYYTFNMCISYSNTHQAITRINR